MIGTSILHKGNRQFVCISQNGNNVREFELIKGETYIIKPLIDNSKRNTGRIIIFKEIDDNYGIAKVQFRDNKRSGKADIADLDVWDHVENANYSDKREKLSSEPPFYYTEEITKKFQSFLDILETIQERIKEDGIARISQKEIGNSLSISATLVSQRMKQLIRNGALEKIKPAHYRVLTINLGGTPYRDVHQVMEFINLYPQWIKAYKKQAEKLNIPLNDIQRAWGYINQVIK